MPLERGLRLGDYEILEPIGAGGMGEVYRARDHRLDRDVAIKVLPEAVARDAAALARFEREAKAVASLSHPNILAIHELGSAEGRRFAVTELLEGQTLRELVAERALPARKAADLGRQTARGLAAAHDRGVVHRDLKPENLFVTRDGRIKILDFGLAGKTEEEQPQAEATRTSLTAPGTILGTVGYMSPEQVRGEPVDHRSDIFSFGAVLYEMLTGKRAFARDTKAETMTAILKEEPPEISASGLHVPHVLQTILMRCLEKRADERFQSAHDLAFSLQDISEAGLPAVAGPPRKRPSWLLAAALLLVGLAGGAALATLFRVPPPEPPDFTTLTARRGAVTSARFVPGAQTVYYGAAWDGEPTRVYTLSEASLGPRELPFGNAGVLSVSPSGELALALGRHYRVGWEAVGTLARAPGEGSAPRPILEDVLEADWGPDGEELVVAHEVGGIVRIEYPIGKVIYESPGWISSLRAHPDGRRVAFVDHPVRGDNQGEVSIVDRDGKVERLGRNGSQGLAWSPDASEVWACRGGRITALRPGAAPRPILVLPGTAYLLDVEPGGTALMALAEMRRELRGRAPGSAEEINLGWLDWTQLSVLSADGSIAIFEEGNQGTREGYPIYVRSTDGSPPVQIGNGVAVAISPDKSRVLAVRSPFTEPQVVIQPTGPGDAVALDTGELRPKTTGVWLPDDSGVVLVAQRPGDEGHRLYELSFEPGSKPRALGEETVVTGRSSLAVSPDSRFVAATTSDGKIKLFPVDGGEPRVVPGTADDENPRRFSADGRSLYVAGRSTLPTPILRIDLATGARTKVRDLAPGDPAGVFSVDQVQISEDGESYAYSYRRINSRLVLVEGLR